MSWSGEREEGLNQGGGGGRLAHGLGDTLMGEFNIAWPVCFQDISVEFGKISTMENI